MTRCEEDSFIYRTSTSENKPTTTDGSKFHDPAHEDDQQVLCTCEKRSSSSRLWVERTTRSCPCGA